MQIFHLQNGNNRAFPLPNQQLHFLLIVQLGLTRSFYVPKLPTFPFESRRRLVPSSTFSGFFLPFSRVLSESLKNADSRSKKREEKNLLVPVRGQTKETFTKELKFSTKLLES
jgi:hypothetical protein